MNKILLSLFSIIILFASSVLSITGVECSLLIFQHDQASNKSTKIYSDTLQFQEGMTSTGFFSTFSLELTFKKIDTHFVEFDAHLITLASQAETYSRNFTMEYDLPARITNIKGKNSSQYILQIIPMARIEFDSADCPYNHLEKDIFKFTPTAHTDLYFLKNSFGDFYWNLVKGILEENYRRFKKLFNFSLPGKYGIYLAPCATRSVMWDPRFGTSCNPTKNTAFSIYNRNKITFDPFILNHTAILRNYGYAPLFLSEGLANYFSIPEFKMKKIVSENKNIALIDLLNSYTYFTSTAVVADNSAASFVRYLIRQFGFDLFLKFYKEADDLNIKESLIKYYKEDISELESGWLNYIDTVKIERTHLVFQIDLSDALFDYDNMLRYSEGLLNLATSAVDSTAALTLKRQAYFNLGDYHNVLEIQKILTGTINTAGEWMKLGTYKMMNGFYDEAASDLLTALSLDSSSSLIKFNLALLEYYQGNFDLAREKLTEIIIRNQDNSAQGESRILLAIILSESKNKTDSPKAFNYFAEARDIFERFLQSGDPAPQYRLWLGIAYFGLNDTDNAYNNLQTANFLELRPFYLGMTTLWLGKLADDMQDREAAKDFYGQVLSLSSAAYHRQVELCLVS